VIGVRGQAEIARKVDLHAMAFADGDGGQDIQKLVEDLRGGFGGTHAEAFAQAVSSRLAKHATGSRFGYGAFKAASVKRNCSERKSKGREPASD